MACGPHPVGECVHQTGSDFTLTEDEVCNMWTVFFFSPSVAANWEWPAEVWQPHTAAWHGVPGKHFFTPPPSWLVWNQWQHTRQTSFTSVIFWVNLVILAGNPSLEAAVHLVSCRGSKSAADGTAASLSQVWKTFRHQLNCWHPSHVRDSQNAIKCVCGDAAAHTKSTLPHPSLVISVHCATSVALWLQTYFSQNKNRLLNQLCVRQYLRYRTGDRLSESHLGLSHHTGTVVFPFHPLKKTTKKKNKTQKWF